MLLPPKLVAKSSWPNARVGHGSYWREIALRPMAGYGLKSDAGCGLGYRLNLTLKRHKVLKLAGALEAAAD